MTFIARLVASGALTLLIKGGAALCGYSIAWWLAALVSLALVFGSWLIIVDTD